MQGCDNGCMTERRCRYCQKSFQLSKFQPRQVVCGELACQRKRRTEYHRQKIAADPEYRAVCRDSPENGEPAIRITERVTAWNIPKRLTGIASSRSCVIGNGICAILQTTPQLGI